MTQHHDPITDSMNDPRAPWHYLDNPQEGFVRVWHGTGEFDFVDMTEDDVTGAYVDANIVNFAVQPVPVTLEIDNEPFTVYYADGNTFETTLSQIGDTPLIGSKWIYLSGGLIGVGTDELTPLFNPYTTPGLHLIKYRLHERVRELAEQQLEMAMLVNAFAQIVAEYGQLENPAQALLRELMRPSHEQH